MDTQTRDLFLNPRTSPALGTDRPSAEPSHIHIPRPSRLRRRDAARSEAPLELTEADEPELPLAPAA